MPELRTERAPTEQEAGSRVVSGGVWGRAVAWLRTPEGITFLVLFVPVLAMRVIYSLTISDLGADGGYYSDVAGHVRDGEGLVTDISVFHQGFAQLPHPTPVYPAWPLLLGYVARVVPLPIAATWLPTLISLVALGFAFVVGRRFAPAPLWGGDGPSPRLPVHGGHLLLAMYALSPSYLTSTARPYTEALAFLGLFAFLWRAPRLFARAGVAAGLECGLWMAFLLYSRSQHVIVILSVCVVVALGILRDARRGAWVAFLGTALVTLVAAFLPFQRSIDAWLARPGFGRYLRFDAARAPSALSEVPIMFPTDGALAWVLDRLGGVQAAFTWGGRDSYYDGLGALAFALPVALVGGAWAAWRARRDGRLAGWVESVLAPERRWHLLFVTVGLAAVSSLHTVHKVYGDEWAFGQRHSLVAGVGFFAAVIALCRLRGIWALLAFGLTIASIEHNAHDAFAIVDRQVVDWRKGERLATDHVDVRQHLEAARTAAGGRVTVAVNRPWPQRLAWRTPGVGYHWLTETTTFDDLRLMVDQFGVTEVLLFPGIEPAFLADPRFVEQFELVKLLPYGNPSPPVEPAPAASPPREFVGAVPVAPRPAVEVLGDAPVGAAAMVAVPAGADPDTLVKVYLPRPRP